MSENYFFLLKKGYKYVNIQHPFKVYIIYTVYKYYHGGICNVNEGALFTFLYTVRFQKSWDVV